jgi:tartrate dehydrogenase/decarboxylase/D-malate dehydrogenase
MFEHLGHPDAAADLKQAVRGLLGSAARTPDLGGGASTAEVVSALRALV